MVQIIEKFEDIPSVVASAVREGDIVLTLGAGDIYKAGKMILDEIAKK